jgi:hypothetical protein
MDASTRAAFQGLIAAAAAIGIGALLAGDFFGRSGRRDRDVGFTVFEVFSVIAILTGSFMTGYFSIAYLKAGEEVSDAQFAQVGIPLIVSVALLVLLRTIAKFSALHGGLGNHVATIAITVFSALVIPFVVTLQSARPEYIIPEGGLILAVGAILGGAFLLIERYWVNDSKKAAKRRVAGLASKGYQPNETPLRPGLPGGRQFAIVYWSKKGKIYLDPAECCRLKAEVDRRWDGLVAGDELPPLGELILTRVAVTTKAIPWPPHQTFTLEVSGINDRSNRQRELAADSEGLFDITDLALV